LEFNFYNFQKKILPLVLMSVNSILELLTIFFFLLQFFREKNQMSSIKYKLWIFLGRFEIIIFLEKCEEKSYQMQKILQKFMPCIIV